MNEETRSTAASSLIRSHMIWSMGAGVIPVPMVDFLAVSAIQMDMVKQLSALYGIEFNKSKGKAVITALTSTSLAKMGASRMIKMVPVIGSVLGAVTMSVLSGASTYAIGEVFKKHFETGGTFLDFDTDRLKKQYDEKFEKGKKEAEKIQKETKQKDEVTETSNMVTQLKELAELKENGLITADEYEKLKAKLLGI
ncbi:MAG TPA: DUF697 domain-containing protein [Saprospiraceae bacterium]|nr:DUF697 domain-containing protein [Saprospiraceae bacterium]